MTPDRSVTALATTPQAPRRRYRRPASADFLALPSLGACCPPPAPSASLTAPSATPGKTLSVRGAHPHAGRSGVNASLRCAFNITASYAKSGQSLRKLRLVARPPRALRVRISAVMSCAPARPTSPIGAARGFSQRCAQGGLRATVGLRLRVCRRTRYGRQSRQSVGKAPSHQRRLFDFSRCQTPVRRSRSASSFRPVTPEHMHRACPANARRCASASPSVCRRRR